MPDVILVTGGHGLVGKAIQHVLATEEPNSRYGRRDGETWIFARSSDGDLRYEFPSPYHFFHQQLTLFICKSLFLAMRSRQRLFLRNTNPPMSFTWLLSVRYRPHLPKIKAY